MFFLFPFPGWQALHATRAMGEDAEFSLQQAVNLRQEMDEKTEEMEKRRIDQEQEHELKLVALKNEVKKDCMAMREDAEFQLQQAVNLRQEMEIRRIDREQELELIDFEEIKPRKTICYREEKKIVL